MPITVRERAQHAVGGTGDPGCLSCTTPREVGHTRLKWRNGECSACARFSLRRPHTPCCGVQPALIRRHPAVPILSYCPACPGTVPGFAERKHPIVLVRPVTGAERTAWHPESAWIYFDSRTGCRGAGNAGRDGVDRQRVAEAADARGCAPRHLVLTSDKVRNWGLRRLRAVAAELVS